MVVLVVVVVAMAAVPATPTISTATNWGWSGMKLTWANNAAATKGWRVYYGIGGVANIAWPSDHTTVMANDVIFTGLSGSTIYTVQLTALNDDGESARSVAKTVTTAPASGDPDNYGTKCVARLLVVVVVVVGRNMRGDVVCPCMCL